MIFHFGDTVKILDGSHRGKVDKTGKVFDVQETTIGVVFDDSIKERFFFDEVKKV
jgi:ribosomal protein L24